LFHVDDEACGVRLPFIKEGFECGDRSIHVVNPDQRDVETVNPSSSSTSIERMLHGALDRLFKPFSETALLDALNAAFRMR
jgi:hypothetical protein